MSKYGLILGYERSKLDLRILSLVISNIRQGGGSTFGVLTSITMKAFPSAPFISAVGILGTAPGGEEAYWDVLANVLSQYASLDAQHISVYSF
jgi:hypothetical protein